MYAGDKSYEELRTEARRFIIPFVGIMIALAILVMCIYG